MQHTIIFYKRLIASRASSQTSFHLENIMNISRQRHIITLLRIPMYKKLRRIFSHGYFPLAHERSGVETD